MASGDLVRPFAASVTQQRGWDVWLWPFTNLWVGPRCLSWSVGWGGVGWGGGKGDEGEKGKGRQWSASEVAEVSWECETN
jgi:hypothetical protein